MIYSIKKTLMTSAELYGSIEAGKKAAEAVSSGLQNIIVHLDRGYPEVMVGLISNTTDAVVDIQDDEWRVRVSAVLCVFMEDVNKQMLNDACHLLEDLLDEAKFGWEEMGVQ